MKKCVVRLSKQCVVFVLIVVFKGSDENCFAIAE